MFNDLDVIASYSQEQALEDNNLFNLSELFSEEVRECGIKIPLFCTRSVYMNYVKLTKAADNGLHSEKGRAWDLIFMSRPALKAAARTRKSYLFKFSCVVKRSTASVCTCKVVYDVNSFIILEKNED
jgi:hypothetical protein